MVRAVLRRQCASPWTIVPFLGIGSILALVMAAAPEGSRESPAPHTGRGTRFQFQVVESFDARYAGDTPGHIGRGGGLAASPHVALGDTVHHAAPDQGAQPIGVVTGATWDRLRGSLTIEFRPRADERIAVGDAVWLEMAPDAAVAAPP